jgi:hypothetical protein
MISSGGKRETAMQKEEEERGEPVNQRKRLVRAKNFVFTVFRMGYKYLGETIAKLRVMRRS